MSNIAAESLGELKSITKPTRRSLLAGSYHFAWADQRHQENCRRVNCGQGCQARQTRHDHKPSLRPTSFWLILNLLAKKGSCFAPLIGWYYLRRDQVRGQLSAKSEHDATNCHFDSYLGILFDILKQPVSNPLTKPGIELDLTDLRRMPA